MVMRLKKTLNAIIGRCRSNRGESITEVLVSVAIGGLALLMLAMAISAAFQMVTQNRNNMETYYETSNDNIQKASGNRLGTGTVSLESSDTPSSSISIANGDASVTYYGDDDGSGWVLYVGGAS